jgi:exodeoxyribonuclease V alpha subunit
VVCKNNIAILNGFAGAGKTYSTKGVINMLKDNYKSFRLFSPTGRAAKVLHENTNEPASTIHRGLGYVPPNKWTFNEWQKLHTDVVIVDEFSMVDIWLFKRLLEAIDFKRTKLLIIGDNAQLPSVSCGNLLHDFMEASIIPTVTLNKIFRYSSGGLMRVATDTRCCKEYLTKDMKAKATTFGDNQDYMFIDLASEIIPKNVVALYKKLLDNGSSIEDIQVLTAKNVGDCGSVVLNNMIQRVANPNYGSEVNMKVGDTTYYKGDLVLQCVNNYEAEIDRDPFGEDNEGFGFGDETSTAFVANGETGIIKEIYNTYVIVDFNGIRVKYYRNDMNMVKLGYAISIHKSQGGGFKTVILCSPQSHIFMLNSNLLYVGLTRMKEKLYHLGSLQSVNQAVKKKANLTRHTFMQKLLKISENDIDK